MEVKRREPIAVVEYVLRRLERQAIDIGSHPVLIHEGLEALSRLREENAQLKAEGTRLAELVQKYHPAYLGLPHVVLERDEARANCVRMSMRAGELGIEVSRLEGLIVALSEDERGLVTGEVHAEADRIRAALRGGGE